MPAALQTERLLLRPLELADAAQTQRLFPHWEIVKFLKARVPWPYPEDGAADFYQDVALPAMMRGEEWHWTLRLKSSPAQQIGVISLKKNEQDNRGFWIGLPWQGQGLMTEAVIAVTDYWFHVLGFERMRVQKAIGNSASRRISEKTGMRLAAVGERDFVCGRRMAETWEITAEEWRRSRTAPFIAGSGR